jgi:hypothetical protein
MPFSVWEEWQVYLPESEDVSYCCLHAWLSNGPSCLLGCRVSMWIQRYRTKSLRGPDFISSAFGVCVGLVPEGAWSLWDFCAVDSSAV